MSMGKPINGPDEDLHIIGAAIIKPIHDNYRLCHTELFVIFTQMDIFEYVSINKFSLVIRDENLPVECLQILNRYFYYKISLQNVHLATLVEKFNVKIFEYDGTSYDQVKKQFRSYIQKYDRLTN